MSALRLAVTGADGQVASALIAAARAAGMVCTVLARPEFDLTRPSEAAALVAAARPDIVINAAAYTAVDDAEAHETLAFAVNADGAAAVAEGATRAGAAMIHLSTDYVFAGDKSAAYREDDPTGPATAYGRSKLAGETAVLAACDRAIVLRTSWIYAPAGRNFVATMLRLAATRDEIGVVDDQRGCPTYAPHIAAGVLAIVRQAAKWRDPYRGVFHMAGADAMSWCSFAAAIFAASARHGLATARAKPIATADYPTPARRPRNSVLDGARLAETFGVRLPGVADGLRDYFATIAATRQGADAT